MDLDSLTQLVLDQKRDLTDNFIDTDEIKRYFNQFGRKLNAEHDLDFTQTSTGVSYIDGTNKYTLPTDFKAPIDLFYNYSNSIEYVMPQDFEFLLATEPNMWASDNRFLYINTSFGTATLSCSYYSTYMAKTSGGSWIAELSTSTDEPLMPEMFQDAYVEYALVKCYKKEGANDDAADSQARLDKLIKDIKNEYVSRRLTERKSMGHVTQFNTLKPVDKSNPLG